MRNLSGLSQGAYVGGLSPVASPSQSDGVALFDSDFLDNAGIAGAFGTGTSPSPHRGELISPRIDLTGYTDEALAVRFYAYRRQFEIAQLAVAMSVDDGATWTDAVDYQQLIANLAQGFVEVNFSTVTAGVADLTKARVKFIFEGDYYFAIVDDVSVRTANAFDLALGVLDPSSNNFVEQGDVVHITGSRFFPASQLAADERHLGFGGTIRNTGSQSALPELNPRLDLVIERDVEGTWTPVHTDSIAVSEPIPAGGYVFVNGTLSSGAWALPGDYRATYTARLDGPDGDAGNDSLTHDFTLTPNDYVSLVDVDAEADPVAPNSVFPAGGPFDSIELGSVFYFDAATDADLSITGLSYTYRLGAGFSPNLIGADQTLQARVYGVDASSGTLDSRELLEFRGACELQLTGLGTDVAPGTTATARCSPADAMTFEPPLSLTTGHYFVSVTIGPGQPFTFADVPLFGVSEQKNYRHNALLGGPGLLTLPSVVLLTPTGNGESIFPGGFNTPSAISIGIDLAVDASALERVFDDGFETP